MEQLMCHTIYLKIAPMLLLIILTSTSNTAVSNSYVNIQEFRSH